MLEVVQGGECRGGSCSPAASHSAFPGGGLAGSAASAAALSRQLARPPLHLISSRLHPQLTFTLPHLTLTPTLLLTLLLTFALTASTGPPRQVVGRLPPQLGYR